MKIQLLPSTFDSDGRARSPEQRLSCYLVDDRVAIDAGSLGLAATDAQRETVRDIIISHTHIDHVASLPIFIDDLFATLDEPVRVHATEEIIELLERDIFNWRVYPRFADLSNDRTRVMEYVPFRVGEPFRVAHLSVTAVPVNHVVPTVGLVISNGRTTLAYGADTAETDLFWQLVNSAPRLDALIIECSFPNSMHELAQISKHLTPATVGTELKKLKHKSPDIFAVHLKPAYRDVLISELAALNRPRLQVMEPGREYEY
ncbi:MAG: 3',5'-cyclic-nucleotide phosphodiesterase [Pyrinomonadaceae bacterium]|nr:3',5'-cyclic-nucleotide phosphodiesterase [Pyrinomonadaceae bacterium]